MAPDEKLIFGSRITLLWNSFPCIRKSDPADVGDARCVGKLSLQSRSSLESREQFRAETALEGAGLEIGNNAQPAELSHPWSRNESPPANLRVLRSEPVPGNGQKFPGNGKRETNRADATVSFGRCKTRIDRRRSRCLLRHSVSCN